MDHEAGLQEGPQVPTAPLLVFHSAPCEARAMETGCGSAPHDQAYFTLPWVAGNNALYAVKEQ